MTIFYYIDPKSVFTCTLIKTGHDGMNEVFQNISKIIERDSKSTTYKFALLRGVIDIIKDNSPFIIHVDGRVVFPLGLLVEKWLIYYYPIIESELRQIHGGANLAFGPQFELLIRQYSCKGGLSAFYNDLRNIGIPAEVKHDFLNLVYQLYDTITRMPMKYLGRSINNSYYSIFQFEAKKKRRIGEYVSDKEFLIKDLGTFSIPVEYYNAFRILGSFISGQDSILFKWAEFSVNASGKRHSVETILNEVLKSPISERDILDSKKIYKSILKEEGNVFCVWTGKSITGFDIDHVIPFSVWKNNDLWNLLPSSSKINNQKRNKIPSADMIENQKEMILHYWGLLDDKLPQRFQKEIRIALTGHSAEANWQSVAIEQLKGSSEFLINSRGYEGWKL